MGGLNYSVEYGRLAIEWAIVAGFSVLALSAVYCFVSLRKAVQALAAELGIRLLFLPSYSPNLNVIERLWGFTKRTAVYGKYHANFASFRSAIEATLAGIPTTHANALESLATLKFQTFEDVSLLAA